MALSIRPTPVRVYNSGEKLRFVAFAAITFSGPAKGFLAVMAGPAKFTSYMVSLGNLCIFLHLEDFCVTFRAF